MAETLLGRNNPGAKLPVTVARNAGQVPIYYNHKPSALRGWLFEDQTPLFPFGYGLSYTSFAISEPRLSATQVAADAAVAVRCTVTNTGALAGDEVVQLYITRKDVSVTQPVLLLKDFARVSLAPGESRELAFTLTPEKLAFFNRDMVEMNEPGTVTVHLGSSSAAEALKGAELTVL